MKIGYISYLTGLLYQYIKRNSKIQYISNFGDLDKVSLSLIMRANSFRFLLAAQDVPSGLCIPFVLVLLNGDRARSVPRGYGLL